MMIIKQIPVGYLDNFCYIVGCKKTRKALVVDPGSDTERILSEADAENLEIITIVNTHGHGDHTAGILTAANFLSLLRNSGLPALWPRQRLPGSRQSS